MPARVVATSDVVVAVLASVGYALTYLVALALLLKALKKIMRLER